MMLMPRPACAADMPTTWVRKTALPVLKVPSPSANTIDCTARRRESGVGGIRRAKKPRAGEGEGMSLI
ncbi:hypothetical protein GCM10009798_12430 [Nocardioides panacihumi]|uniref:Uncharacterized protein n=1 Tax=Nocardioides panacihumi TaxID=400774 RepID=A0ABP5BYF3_9ACTN